MSFKKIALLIIAMTILFCSGFFTAKWINKSKTEEVSDIIKTPVSSLGNNQNISPTGVQNIVVPAEQTILEVEPIASSNLILNLKNKAQQKNKTAVSPWSTLNSDKTAISTPSQMQTDETELISTMHQMSNGLIKAKDGQIWGVIAMTKNKVSELTKIINDNNYIHRYDLLQILEKWKEGDFTQIVDNHNTLWRYLNGNIGEAINPNEKIINGKYPDFN